MYMDIKYIPVQKKCIFTFQMCILHSFQKTEC